MNLDIIVKRVRVQFYQNRIEQFEQDLGLEWNFQNSIKG